MEPSIQSENDGSWRTSGTNEEIGLTNHPGGSHGRLEIIGTQKLLQALKVIGFQDYDHVVGASATCKTLSRNPCFFRPSWAS